MNLIETLSKEIKNKGITNKLEIARYIYKRTGNLFKYNPKWYFATPKEKEELKNKHIDILNVTDYNITSYSWANMYNELLSNFGIMSRIKTIDIKVVDSNTKSSYLENIGSNVEVLIDGQVYIADLTKNLNDLVGLKFGLPTNYNCRTNFEIQKKSTSNLENIKNNTEISKLKQMLEIIKVQKQLNAEEYNYQVYRAIEKNIDFSKLNIGFSEGNVYVDLLLKAMIGNYYTPNNICFFDKEKDKYMSVYIVPVNGINEFFSYENGTSILYKFNNISKETLDFYFDNYEYVLSDNLKRIVNMNESKELSSVNKTM